MQSKLDRLWAVEGIRATVLKDRAISQYYAVPHHRYSCDLDMFIGEGWEWACELLEGQGVELGREVYKEVEFMMDDVYVECHRYITPLRGNRQLQAFERYLRSLLESGKPTFFEGTTLVCPPLMFSVMLYVEHALGDFLLGKLLLKHVVDWVVLRRQAVEGKREYEALPAAYKEAFDEMLREQEPQSGQRSWFQRRVSLFFDIIRNGKKFHRYGYTSMPSFLFHSVWTHFFEREVRGI